MIEGLTDESLIVSPYVAPGEGGGLFSFTSTDE
jgi:hypothetical protein